MDSKKTGAVAPVFLFLGFLSITEQGPEPLDE
jgi:hypothetical protein